MASTRKALVPVAIALAAMLRAGEGWGQSPGSSIPEVRTEAAVGVRDVSLSGDVVSGTLVNRSSREVRDIGVLVTRAWLWRDEQHPGPINPGGTYAFKVPGPIAQGATTPFRFELPTVDAPADLGSFHATAAVTGFTEVEYPGR